MVPPVLASASGERFIGWSHRVLVGPRVTLTSLTILQESGARSAGNASAFMQLITQRSPRIGKAVFMGTWGLVQGAEGGLDLAPEAALSNPLLAVMLARLQEGCRLMYASGECTPFLLSL